MVALSSLLPAAAFQSHDIIHRDCESPGLSHEQLIDRIQALNPTASADYLASFDEPALSRYLDHLTAAAEPRGRFARWARLGETRAIMCFVPAEDA